jgi:hypothetical protein
MSAGSRVRNLDDDHAAAATGVGAGQDARLVWGALHVQRCAGQQRAARVRVRYWRLANKP